MRSEVVEENSAASVPLRDIFFALILFLVIPTSFFAQKKDSVAQFKVRFTNGDYKFVPADGYLYMKGTNKLRITNTKKNKFEVKLIGGTIKSVNDSIFEIDGLIKSGTALLCIYETDAKGKQKAVLNKPMTVIPFPKVKFGGVKSDSAASVFHLAASTFNAHFTTMNKKVPVTFFKMEIYEKDKFTLDSSNTNRLSKKMLAYLEKQKPGSMLYFSDIRYKDPSGNEHTEPVYRVFIIKDSGVLKFGID